MTSKKVTVNPRAIFVAFFSVLALTLVIKYSDTAIDSVKNALHICANTVIPSLFPFMVISELIISLGASKYLGKILSPIFRPIFDLNEHAASAFILGTLCGFPVGARTAVSLYEQGKLDENEVSRVLCFCNNPSSAFVISAIGISLFGSRALGIAMYVITLLSAIIIGIFLRFICGKGKHKNNKKAFSNINDQTSGVHIFTKAVTDSAGAMITVCAFIIFFSSFLGMLRDAFAPTNTPDTIVSAVMGFFELTNGVTYAASHTKAEIAILLCAAIAGWSGLSVHFQIMSICKGLKISFRPYFAAKAAQGILNGILVYAYMNIFKPHISIPSSIDIPAFLFIPEPIVKALFVTFVISAIFGIFRKLSNRNRNRPNTQK